jgi:hypothetical protein
MHAAFAQRTRWTSISGPRLGLEADLGPRVELIYYGGAALERSDRLKIV